MRACLLIFLNLGVGVIYGQTNFVSSLYCLTSGEQEKISASEFLLLRESKMTGEIESYSLVSFEGYSEFRREYVKQFSGFDGAAFDYWLSFRLLPTKDSISNYQKLYFYWGYHDQMSLYVKPECSIDTIEKVISNLIYPSTTGGVFANYVSFEKTDERLFLEFTVDLVEPKQVFIRIHSIQAFLFPYNPPIVTDSINKVVIENNLLKKVRPEYAFDKTVIGILFFVGILALIQLIITADRVYLYYGLYVLSYVSIFSVQVAIFFPFDSLIFYSPYLLYFLTPSIIFSSNIFYYQFVRRFLSLDQTNAKFDSQLKRLEQFFIVLIFVELLFHFILGDTKTALSLRLWVISILVPISLFALIRLYQIKLRLAKFIFWGSLALFVCSIIGFCIDVMAGADIMRPLNPVLPPNYSPFVKIGIIIEVLAFSSGLMYRVKELQKDRIQRMRNEINLSNENRRVKAEKALEESKLAQLVNLTHDFRTPLTIINLNVDTVLQENISQNSTAKGSLETVKFYSQYLGALVNDLLDLSRLDQKILKLDFENCVLKPFLQNLTHDFVKLASSQQKYFNAQINFTDEVVVELDPYRLGKIVRNLISNAIKFTPAHGEISIEFFLNERHLNFHVKDTGIGIPDDELFLIFNRFYQSQQVRMLGYQGSGVGLNMVKELVNLMGGDILVKSKVGTGTTFEVKIPIQNQNFPLPSEPLDSRQEMSNVGEEWWVRQHLTVVIIEDNTDLLESLSKVFQRLGVKKIFLAQNGREGFETIISQLPDIIISDVIMPEVGGFELVENLKSDIRTSHIPVLLFTIKNSLDARLTSLELGADGYLAKPFEEKLLLSAVRQLLEQRHRYKEYFLSVGQQEFTRIPSKEELFIAKTKKLIMDHLADEVLSVQFLADNLNFNRVHLYRKIHGLTGFSPQKLIRHCRLHEAKRLLATGKYQVQEVVDEIGMKHNSTFSKNFKEEFGLSPLEFIKSKKR